MIKINETEIFYRKKAFFFKKKFDKVQQKSNVISIFRLMAFLSSIVFFVFFIARGHALPAILCGSILFSAFITLVALSVKVNRQKQKTAKLLEYNENEIRAVNYDFSKFNAGSEFQDTDHPYLYDLDIFAEGSVFQMINRCTTMGGQYKLARKLSSLETNPEKIKGLQEALKELAKQVDWRQLFWAEGQIFIENTNDQEEIKNWLKDENLFLSSNIYRLLTWVLPMATCATLLLNIFAGFSISFFITAFFLQLIVTGFSLKKVNKVHGKVSRKFGLLKKYSGLFVSIENKEFSATYLAEIKSQLSGNKHSAFKQFKQLSKIVNALDSRLNIIVSILMNGLVLWDIRNVIRLEKWKKINKNKVAGWFNVLSEVDALNGLANFTFNQPGYCFPEIEEKQPFFRATNLGHPLINSKSRVCNDFELVKKGQFSIVTGANMAGKSTFLRTVGVNLVLAGCGAPVCASHLEMQPVSMFTSMRTNDSLQKNESYFYTELKRLKFLLQQISENKNIFILLDEILKGTNSVDKQNGSRAFLVKLLKLNATGIIATHDLALANIEKEYPERIKNICFEIEIDGSDIHFDYKLRQGVTKKMNASLLLRQMDLICTPLDESTDKTS